MTIVDTSVWIEFLRSGDERTARLIAGGGAVVHPFVYAEIACGRIEDRRTILSLLRALPSARMASMDETLDLLETRRLYGLGLSFVDLSLLAAALLNACGLATHDKALARAARRLGIRPA